MANFAKSQLLKYGWTEGKGLGKKEDGITEALKPTLKFDNAGIGHKEIDTNKWWETAFNNAAKNIKVESCNDKVSLSVIDNTCNTVLSNNENKNQTLEYGKFVKTCTFHNGRLMQNVSEMSETKKDVTDSIEVSLTDEQLFKACGGRTVHKAARHACTLNGKLKRIEQQDNMLLSNSNSSEITKKDTMFRMKRKFESDTDDADYETDGNANSIASIALLQHEEESNLVRSKSTTKKHKKRINNLVQQLSSCKIKENGTDSECTSPNNKKLYRKRKRSKDRKATLKSLQINLKKNSDKEVSEMSLPDIKHKEKKNTKKIKIGESEIMYNECSNFLKISHHSKKKKKSKHVKNRDKQNRIAEVTEIMIGDLTIRKSSHKQKIKDNASKKQKCKEGSKDDLYFRLINQEETEKNILQVNHLKTIAALNFKIEKKKERRRHVDQSSIDILQKIKKNISKYKMKSVVKSLTAVSLKDDTDTIEKQNKETNN